MDIDRMIKDLKAERERLDSIITALERLQNEKFSPTPRRRGRKFMDKKDREEVSERMKRYWEGRRNGSAPKRKSSEVCVSDAAAPTADSSDSSGGQRQESTSVAA